MTLTEIISIVSILIQFIFLIIIFYSNTVIKERLSSQQTIISNVEKFMSIFNVDELKKYVEVTNKTKDLALQNYIQTESQKFAKDGEQYIADMLGDEIAKSAKYINDDAY
ncbi:MAG: hypothetical protein ACRCSB_00005, partial [Bacteroidales bacterium]